MEELPVQETKRGWGRVVLWVLLTPLLLFVLLMALLYVPPVQNIIRQKATEIASEATGMNISVQRIDLRFPLNLLVRGVKVVQEPDTLLDLQRLSVRVQAWPLLKGQVEVDEVLVEDAVVNSANFIEGMHVQGNLGRFFLESHGIDLSGEEIVLNEIELNDTKVAVLMNDTTTTPPDSASAPLNWKINLHSLALNNVDVALNMPLDSMRLSARLGSAKVLNAKADLLKQHYACQQFVVDKTALTYDVGNTTPVSGFDPSHIALRDIAIGVDSLLFAGENLGAIIRKFSLNERSGLSLVSVDGRLRADTSVVEVPQLRLRTAHSEMSLRAHTYWRMINMPTTGHLTARFDARIGKQDIMLLAAELPNAFKEAYPEYPLVISAGTDGNLRQMQLSRFEVDLPGAFNATGEGSVYHLTDSLLRNGQLNFAMQTHDLNFLKALAGVSPDSLSVVVPDSMQMNANLTFKGPQYQAHLDLQEAEGLLNLNAKLNASTLAYEADLMVDSLELTHFLPQDSLSLLTTNIKASGQGFDLASPQTKADIQAVLDHLHYGHWKFDKMQMHAGLNQSVASLKVDSDNDLLKLKLDGNMRFDRTYLDGTLDMDVNQVDLYGLGIAPKPLKRPFAFTVASEARHDSVKLQLNAGDMNFRFRARSTLKKMIEQGNEFATLLMQQIDERKLNHAALRELMPSAGFHLKAGKDNPISYFLATKDISYNDFRLSFGLTPQTGINGRASVHGFRMDSLQMDTIYILTKQDTTHLRLQAGVINAPGHPHVAFNASLTGEVRNEDAELLLNFVDANGETGVNFGLNARPLTEGNGKGNGMLLRITPEEPILAFRKFHFVDDANWAYLHKNMRAYANIDMEGEDGLGFKMLSNQQDTVSLQNMNIELSRLNLDLLSDVLPYMPRIGGLFTIETHYVQTESSLQLSADSNIEQFSYEGRLVGDIGLGATWLPADDNRHFLNAYMLANDQEVIMADGELQAMNNQQRIDLNTMVDHFPLPMLNAFVPDEMITLTGSLIGDVSVGGTLDKPQVEGELTLDSVTLFARQAGARYRFDNRSVKIADNQMHFNKFAIYTNSENPFTIDGVVDFRKMDMPTANLNLFASKYTFLDAPRTRESLIYGKIVVDLDARLRGPLNALTLRGNMNLLGSTNVTYVLTESPLTVEDRLDGLVTFTSFADTTQVAKEDATMVSLGGMDMNMSVHIDDAVRLRADLSSDRSKYIELEGGGDLNMLYTPQGDLSLTGRYTLSGGTMNYSLPIIPLKEFAFSSGSYVDWRGDIMNPDLNLKATERLRAAVSDGDGGSRMVNFDVSISIKNKLEAPELVFDIAAPEDATIQNELQAMGAEERSKQAIAMLATGIYLNSGVKGNGLDMGSALNSVLQSQINALAGSALNSSNASFSMGVENRTSAETGDTQTDYSFRYSQRFFNDRVQIVIGGKVSTGNNATNTTESFIDNISLEYRLDNSGTRYVRVFHNKNYESVLDGEITETGAGLVLRKKLNNLGELFIFKKK